MEPQAFGARLRELRERASLSQRELSRRTASPEHPKPIPIFTLSRLENSVNAPRPLTVRRLAQALGVGIESLTSAPPITLRDYLLAYQAREGKDDQAMAALLDLTDEQWQTIRRRRTVAWRDRTLGRILIHLPSAEVEPLVLDELRRKVEDAERGRD